MNFIVFIIILVVVVGATAGLTWYFTDQEHQKKVESASEEFKQLCEQEKTDIQTAAQTVLNNKLAEKDAELAALKSKYEAQIKDGTLTLEQAKTQLQADLDAANAEIAAIKTELETQVQLLQTKENQIVDLQNKRVCARIAGVRKAGAGFLEGDAADHAANYGAAATLDECEQSCKGDLECKQFVWWKGDGTNPSGCFPIKNSYENGVQDANFVSGTCSA